MALSGLTHAMESIGMDERSAVETHSLVRRCQEGDRQAFNRLISAEQGWIVRLVHRMLDGGRQAGDVADVVQDVFVIVFRKIGSFRFDSNFQTWLTRIAVNQCLKHRRRERLRSTWFGPAVDTVVDRGIADERGPSALQQIEDREQRAFLHAAINDLPEKQRTAILLRYFEERSCEDIATIVRCSAGTVRSRLFNARKALRQWMESHEDQGERDALP